MHCPKCGSIIQDDTETCRFCKEKITETDRQKEVTLAGTSKPTQLKQVQETKNTCQGCGHVWFYDQSDKIQNFGDKMGATGDSLIKNSCCCLFFPFGLLALLIPDKKVQDLNRCPKCNSRAIQKETITHSIQK